MITSAAFLLAAMPLWVGARDSSVDRVKSDYPRREIHRLMESLTREGTLLEDGRRGLSKDVPGPDGAIDKVEALAAFSADPNARKKEGPGATPVPEDPKAPRKAAEYDRLELFLHRRAPLKDGRHSNESTTLVLRLDGAAEEASRCDFVGRLYAQGMSAERPPACRDVALTGTEARAAWQRVVDVYLTAKP